MEGTENIFQDDPITRTVQLLDLRNTRTYMHDSRRNVIAAASAKKASPRSVFLASSPMSPATSARSPSTKTFDSSFGDLTAAQAVSMSAGQASDGATALNFLRSLEEERDHARTTCFALEDSMRALVDLFQEHVGAVEATIGPASQFFKVTFGPGSVGMILTTNDSGVVEVAELKDDPETGRPLLAKACGRIFVGDAVLAVNANYLHRYGKPTADQVAYEFRNADRPMTVLFRRNGAVRLAQAGLDGSSSPY
jgi:hypothetical protein